MQLPKPGSPGNGPLPSRKIVSEDAFYNPQLRRLGVQEGCPEPQPAQVSPEGQHMFCHPGFAAGSPSQRLQHRALPLLSPCRGLRGQFLPQGPAGIPSRSELAQPLRRLDAGFCQCWISNMLVVSDFWRQLFQMSGVPWGHQGWAGSRAGAAQPRTGAPPGLLALPRVVSCQPRAGAELSSERASPLMLLPTGLCSLSLPVPPWQVIHR